METNEQIKEDQIEDQKIEENSNSKQKEDLIPRSKYEQVSQDMHKYKARMRELEGEVQAQKEGKLKENQQWEEYAKLKEAEAAEAMKKAEGLQSAFVTNAKYNALKEAALKAGIRQDAIGDLELVDFSDVQVETTSMGRMNVVGAADAIGRFKALKPHWFSGRSNNVNTNSPEVSGGKLITLEDVTKAEQEAIRTNNYSKYKPLLMKYIQQEKKN